MMEKKYVKSKIAVTLYVIAALLLVYTCYLIGSTVAYVFGYYGSYGMAPAAGEVIGYTLQTAYQPLVMTILVFAAAKILDEVRKLNPDNYVEATGEVKATEEETAVVVTEEPAIDTNMTKAELIELAKSYDIKVSSKDTKAQIVAKIRESVNM